MKLRMFIALAALTLACDVSAQRIDQKGSSYDGGFNIVSGGADTTSGADTNYIFAMASLPYDVHFKYVNTKVSGTVAGTATFWGSDDKVTWFALNNTITGLAGGQVSDTAALGDATETNHWFYGGPDVRKFKYYRGRAIYSNGVSAPTGMFYFVNPFSR